MTSNADIGGFEAASRKNGFIEGLKGMWLGFVAYRQHQVLLGVMEGMSDRQLADSFGIRRDQIAVKAAELAINPK